jgi:succinoglycan biosynthesis protein ExoA
MTTNTILISVIVCCYNERGYIGPCLDSLTHQKNITGNLEILVIDGMSNDGTRDIILSKMQTDKRIRFYDNLARVKPQAINLGFRESSGNYFVICDAHALYAEDYLSECLKLLTNHTDTWCVGGPFINIGETTFGKANAIAMNSPIGIGNAKHRHPDYEGYGEMVMFGLYPRDVIEKIGYYDEFFVINHDDEYCYRLRKAGGKVYISHKAKCYYFVRKTACSLFKQYFSYGLWQIAFLKKHKIPISSRQLIPFGFFFTVFLMIVLGILLNNLIVSIALPVSYILGLLIFTIPVFLRNKLFVAINFPIAVFILHFAYAIGFFSGFFKFAGKKIG